MGRVDLRGLPGQEILDKGIPDLRDGVESIEALLVAIGSPRLRGLVDGLPDHVPADANVRLYRLIEAREGDGAHSAYNAWIRRLVSLERALEHQREWERTDRAPTPP